jgi:hypothetical protein
MGSLGAARTKSDLAQPELWSTAFGSSGAIYRNRFQISPTNENTPHYNGVEACAPRNDADCSNTRTARRKEGFQDQKQEGIQLGGAVFRSEYIRQKEKKRENKDAKPQDAANFQVIPKLSKR